MTRVGTVWLDVALDTQRAGRDMETFGKSFTANVSAPLGAVGALAVKGFAGFEASMAKVTGLSGVAREQVQAWTEDVKNIGVEYGQGAQAAGEGLYFITSSGVQGSRAIDTLRESSKAAAAGLGETKVIADLTTSALNAYKGTGLDAARATDILTAAVASGKGEPAEFAESLGQVLPIASALGVSYEQVAGAESAMTLRGLDASEATTALRGIFTTLLKPTQQAEESLAGVGLSSEGLRKQLREKGLLSTLETLTSALGDDAAATGAVFENVRALNGVMNILGENTDDTRRVMDQVANSTGATDRAFESASQTTEFKLDKALAQVKKGFIELGAQIAPTAGAVAGAVGSASEAFGRLPQPVQTGAVAVGTLAAALGPTAFVVGKVTSAVGTSAIAFREFVVALRAANAATATTGLGRLGGMLGSLNTSARAIPAAVGGISAAVVGLAAAYVVLNSRMRDAESIGDPLKKIGDTKIKGAKSFQDLQDFIATANTETAKLQERFGDIKFDPVEREALGSMGAALASSAEQAAKFSGQAIKIADTMGVSKDAAAKWIVEQAKLGHTFENADAALDAYRQSVAGTSATTAQATSETAKLAAAAGPLSEPFFNLQSATRDYASSLRGVAAAQHQTETAARAVTNAERSHDTAVRRVTDAEERRRQSLRAVEDAQRGVTEAQQALNAALRGPSDDEQLNVESAELAVERARQRLADIGKTKPGEKAEPVDPLDRREAELSLRRAENDLGRTRAEVAGRVADAEDTLRGAEDRLSDSQRSAGDAARAVADAHVQVGDAMQGIADARQGAEDATNAVRDAEWQANDAARNLAGSQDAFNAALSRGPNLVGPFVGYLEQLRDRFPEVAAGLQTNIDKLKELETAQAPSGPPRPAEDRAPLNPEGRAYGGPVSAGRPYEVTELGAPELYRAGGQQWIIPTVPGEVVPMVAGGGGGPALVIEHLDVHGPDPVATARRTVIDLSKKAIMAAAR